MVETLTVTMIMVKSVRFEGEEDRKGSKAQVESSLDKTKRIISRSSSHVVILR